MSRAPQTANRREYRELTRARWMTFSWVALLAISIALVWWWMASMEKSSVAMPNPSEALHKNPMLAATRLLEKKHYQVQLEPTLSETVIEKAGSGTLLIANNEGLMVPEQAKALLAWVAKGNTLITFPKIQNKPKAEKETVTPEAKDEKEPSGEEDSSEDEEDEEDEEASSEPAKTRVSTEHLNDPIADFLHISTVFDNLRKTYKRTPGDAPVEGVNIAPKADKVWINMPQVSHLLEIERPDWKLQSGQDAPLPLFADDSGDILRVYGHGKGRIVTLSENIFELHDLQRSDHAEIFLALLALNPQGKQVSIVQRLKISPWYVLLWEAFPFALCLLALAILLSLWRALRRFGPLLPEIELERRSLLEHIEASARWAWSSIHGRELLLDAARLACRKVLERRAPEIYRLSSTEQVQKLALLLRIDTDSMAQAWQDAPARSPLLFTRQIQHLQQLRMHYEHHEH